MGHHSIGSITDLYKVFLIVMIFNSSGSRYYDVCEEREIEETTRQ